MSTAAHLLAGPLAVPMAKGGEAVKAGPVGLVVIVLLCVASYFLFRSMSKHLRTVRENFPSDAPPVPTSGTAHSRTGDAPAAAEPASSQDGPVASEAPGETPPPAT